MLSLGGCFFSPGCFDRRVVMMDDLSPSTLEALADGLLAHGMYGDRATLIQRLSLVGRHRLSSYWRHHWTREGRFLPGTRFEVVWAQYLFDRQLRLLVMDALERIEIALRALLSHHQESRHGPFGYVDDPQALPRLDPSGREELRSRVVAEVRRSRRDPIIAGFEKTHGDRYAMPPIGIAAEVLSFGLMVKLWMASSPMVQRPVTQVFGVSERVLQSWMWSLSEVRNICAHHGRLWNRELGNKPLIPLQKHHPEWHDPVTIRNDRIFAVLTICVDALNRIAPGSRWAGRVHALVERSPEVPTPSMGFPERWFDCPLWRRAL